MSWSNWMRQVHRWVSIAFTLAVIANFAAMGLGVQATWVGLLALAPLFVLLLTGLVLFVQPYRSKAAAPPERR